MSTKVLVSERALIQRINRKLQAADEVLKASRGARMEQECGRYYVLNFRRNFVATAHVDPEALGRELGALRDYERVVKG
jgi:hypothetical protein